MELSVLSHKSPIQSAPIRDQDEPPHVSEPPIQSTPIRDRDEPPDLSESPIQDSPVEQQSTCMTPQNSTPKNDDEAKSSAVSSGVPSTSPSDSSTPSRRKFSAISEFLTPPTIASKKAKAKGKAPAGAHVLTSDDSLALLQEKEKKKKDEEEAKLKRKLEREEKCAAKEIERKRKEEEREKKLLEKRKKAQELEEKRKQRELKRKEKKKPGAARRHGETSRSECGLQCRESTSNECIVCFGDYNDDLDLDGALLREWVRCTNNDCQKWMHEDCVKQEDSCLMCAVCNTEFQ